MGFGHRFLSFNAEESSLVVNDCGGLSRVLQDVGFEDGLICPQPRRMDFMACYIPDLMESVHQGLLSSLPDPRTKYEAGYEVLEILLSGSAHEKSTDWCFTGSPPIRASNPLTRDVQFAQQRIQMAPDPIQPNVHRLPESHRSTFQVAPSVRIEGFDCSGPDANCRVPARA